MSSIRSNQKPMPWQVPLSLAVTASESGTCHGIGFWFDLYLDKNTVYRSESRSRTNHWRQAIYFFPEPVEVKPGDRLDIAAGYDNTRIFFNLLGHRPRAGS